MRLANQFCACTHPLCLWFLFLQCLSCHLIGHAHSCVGKKFNIHLQTLPLPPQVKMFLNYYIPYPGFEVVLLPPSPWTKEELWQKKVKADELRTFMLENGSCEFIEEHKSVLESDATEGSVDDELIRAFQDMYL